MKMNVKKLGIAIDSMSLVCSKGKEDIRNLFREAFGATFSKTSNMQAEKGAIYLKDGVNYIVAVTAAESYVIISLQDGNRWGASGRNLDQITEELISSEFSRVTLKKNLNELANENYEEE